MSPSGRGERTPDFAPLHRLFHARHLAVIGASADPDKIGGRPLRYLDAAGFEGTVHPVNPRYDTILGRPCAPSLRDIREPVDLALVAVPGAAVEAAIDDCAAAGVPFAIVFSSGFAETGAEGRDRQYALVARARAGNVRLVGPNSLGIASSPNGLMASFATLFDRHPRLLPGKVGFISQSGALGVFIYALAQDQQLGFSRFVSIGNEGDLDVADFLAYLADDPETAAIGGYLEGLGDGTRFLAAAERVRAAGKAMSFLKVGRSAAGRRAAESHTGSLAGTDAVYDAAFGQAGIVRAADPQGLVDFLAYHGGTVTRPARQGVGVLTISGGAGVFCADRFDDLGVDLADLTPATVQRLRELLPPFATPQNPLDMTGQILNDPGLFTGYLDALLADPGVGTLMVVLGLQERTGDRYAAQIVEAQAAHPYRSIVVAWLAGPDSATEILRAASVPVFGDLARAVHATAGAIEASAHLGRDVRPMALTTDAGGRQPSDALDTEHAAKQLLAGVGIRVPDGKLCGSLAEVLEAAEHLTYPVALKGQVSGLAHKTDHDLVHLGVADADDACAAYAKLEAATERTSSIGACRGVLVEAMAPPGLDVIVGCVHDEVFGPTIMFGLGGVLVELVDDVVFRVAPVDRTEALAMVAQTQGAVSLMEGYRGGATYDRDAIASVIAQLSALAIAERDWIREIEINPLRVNTAGAVALDALVTVHGDRR